MMRSAALLIILRFCVCSPPNLTIVTVLAYDAVQHQIPWHIRGFLLGYQQLQEQLRDRINITYQFLWQRNVSQCADVASRVVNWASKVFYAASGQAVAFASPGCFQEILELGAIVREWNTLFMTTLGNNFVITPQRYPTIVSMSYRPQSSFDGFVGVCSWFSWKTSVWLCDQDQTQSAFPSGRCSSAQEMLQKQRSFVPYFIKFNSSELSPKELLAHVRPLARIVILSTLPDTVKKIMVKSGTVCQCG
ncbi:uncharacterized protein LOC129596495 [Paramacrobiotus metropolitanus]|uniref:uncharacterized protein LOC129596495 n=1 Tax=Paramacrobiotus metropolitanus TaxID=2943436 RepID=UPI00244651F3|nr:uncharacterized protein LOC129596495 [Paramacrobiotus metropolitanus]